MYLNIYKNIPSECFSDAFVMATKLFTFLRLFYLNKRIKSRRYKRYTLNYFNVKIIRGERENKNGIVEKLNKRMEEEILCDKLYDFL